MATIAVFVALGGAAYALERNSVRSKHIKNGQVRVVDADPDDFVLHDPRAGFDLGASTISHTIFNLGTAGTLDLGTLTLHRESASAFDVCAVGVTSNTPFVVYEGTGTGDTRSSGTLTSGSPCIPEITGAASGEDFRILAHDTTVTMVPDLTSSARWHVYTIRGATP